MLLVPLALSERPLRWEAMVINLDRRPDRLERFVKALQTSEPWLLATGKLCRIAGRDGAHLSLPRGRHLRAGRTEGVKKRLAEVVIPKSLMDVDALVRDGWTTPVALAAALSSNSTWPQMTAGGLGLYLGHAAAWQHVVNSDLDFGVVLEDDLTLFAPTFAGQVAEILGGREDQAFVFRSPWDLLYLQRCNDDAWPKPRAGDLVHHQPPQSVHSAEVPVPTGEVTTCTGAYIITKRGAEIMLADGFPRRAA